jgi:RNA polymerase sigma factor (TIGR02999 family)
MRDILIEQIRRRATIKRGGDRRRYELEDVELEIQAPAEDVLAVGEAVERLESDDPRKGQIVNLRFFVGMTVEETAAALDLSVTTIEREWRYIRAWLENQLKDRDPGEETGGA